jgi:hypothetical protein
MERAAAVDRLEAILDAVESGPLPVPVREVWVFGDLALGVDPIERLDVYLTKDLLLGQGAGDSDALGAAPDVDGVGETVSADWAAAHPDRVRTNDHGHAAPERCLAAHLLRDDEPIHLEVCNASFGDNVVQRLQGARERDRWAEALDPRGVACWIEGERDDEAIERLRDGAFAFPTLEEAFGALGLDADEAAAAAEGVAEWRASRSGGTVRGDVV